jgi:hypothetical protein
MGSESDDESDDEYDDENIGNLSFSLALTRDEHPINIS